MQTSERIFPGEVIAVDVDYETFLRDYMGQGVEWHRGEVIKMSPVTGKHDEITGFLYGLFNYYLSRTAEGKALHHKFSMKLNNAFAPEPDILVVTTPNLERLKETRLEGAADLVVEVVSAGSTAYDRGFKFEQYQAAGVREYWLIDPLRGEALFYVLDENGIYRPRHTQQEYTSAVLPRLRFDVSVLFQDPLPDVGTAVEMVNAMLK